MSIFTRQGLVVTSKPCLYYFGRTLAGKRSHSMPEKLFPNLTPISLTSPLAFELSSTSAHASATFRTDPIRNAGDHFRRCFESVQSEICHIPSGDYVLDLHQRFWSDEKTLRSRSLETSEAVATCTAFSVPNARRASDC